MNTAVATSTGKTPYYLNHLRDFRMPMDLLFKADATVPPPTVEAFVEDEIMRQQEAFELNNLWNNRAKRAIKRQNRKKVEYKIGEFVFV